MLTSVQKTRSRRPICMGGFVVYLISSLLLMFVSSCRSVKESENYSKTIDSGYELTESLTDSIKREINMKFEELTMNNCTLDIVNDVSEYDSVGRLIKTIHTTIKGNNVTTTSQQHYNNAQITSQQRSNKVQKSQSNESVNASSETQKKSRSPTPYIIISVIVLSLIIYAFLKWKS